MGISGDKRAGEAERMPDCGGALDAGPGAHVHRDSAEASGSVGDRFFEREERDCHRAAFYLILRGRRAIYL